ncbi:CAP domain-containing protein [Pinisolibacter aquiterrae]|uniref:CAP domain-containing protein n=1 Tax=Pinisolibacter aquiterrae TaxID=2815579 RepID=UPI001C3E1264|nr:CAP domain-containing protein [Pinisolibacter aquiterrae]MBV5262965.1 CAP domain-containing protein [Pinisolibacter aquiterrae]MCC8235307.1 CAP domain-containing protein [Pinisolibacter aquiterrae]
MVAPLRIVSLSLLLAAGLAACSRGPAPVEHVPPFYQRLDIGGRSVDPASSLSMINQYRANNGLQPLIWDQGLARVAQAEVDQMAAADRVHSTADAGLDRQLQGAGIGYASFLANFSAGYRTFAEAFSGWRESKQHNATMLAAKASRVGLATAYAPNSKYKIFWTLVVVEPR